MVEAARGARGRSALIMGGVTLVRTRDSKLALALTAKYLWSASAWVRKPAPAMASLISVSGSPRSPVLGESGRELGIEFGPRVIREKLAGALRFGLRVVIAQIHVPQRIGDLLIDFGPGVEVQQSRDDSWNRPASCRRSWTGPRRWPRSPSCWWRSWPARPPRRSRPPFDPSRAPGPRR